MSVARGRLQGARLSGRVNAPVPAVEPRIALPWSVPPSTLRPTEVQARAQRRYTRRSTVGCPVDADLAAAA